MAAADEFAERMAQAAAGDRLALGQLLVDHHDLVAQQVAHTLGVLEVERLSVEDLVQQTFVAVVAGIPDYEHHSPQSFARWMEAIADHEVRNAVSALAALKRGGGWQRTPIPTGSSRSSWMALADYLAAPDGSASKHWAKHEAVQAVQVAVASLPDDQRVVVALHHLEGKSVEDTAVTLDRSPGAVRGLLQRARGSLRAAMGSSSRWFEKKQ